MKFNTLGSGKASRLVKSKVWQKVEGTVEFISPEGSGMGFRLAAGGAISVSLYTELSAETR